MLIDKNSREKYTSEVEGVRLILNKTGTDVCPELTREWDQGMRLVEAMEISIWEDITADKGREGSKNERKDVDSVFQSPEVTGNEAYRKRERGDGTVLRPLLKVNVVEE